MQQIINFLIRNKNKLLFLVLLAISLFLTVQSHSFQKSKFINSANFITGGVYSWTSNLENYFHLEEYNKQLLEENRRLRLLLHMENDSLLGNDTLDLFELKIMMGDSLMDLPYHIRSAKVINNNYSGQNNYLTIKGGTSDGITPDMGVVTSDGIVGIVENTSANYATVISLLNANSRINAQLKNSEHYGTLMWNGETPNIVQLIDVPRLAPVSRGDTIITGGRSLIFPKGILIGHIVDYQLDQSESYYTIDIELFNDMTSIGHVYVMEHTEKEEIQELENLSEDD